MNLKEIYKHLGIKSGRSYLNVPREEILSNLNLSAQDKGKIIFRKPIIEMIENFYSKYRVEIINIINTSGNPFMIKKEEYISKIIREIPYLTQSFFDECWQDGSMEDFISETNITPPFYGLVAHLNLEKGIIDGIKSTVNILYMYHHYNQNDSSANYIEGTKDLISELSGIHMTVFIMMSSIIESPQNTDNKVIEKNALQDGEGGSIYFPERFTMNNNKLTLSKDIYNHPVLLGEEVFKQQQYMSSMRLKCPAMHSKNKEGNVITFVLHQLFAEHFQKYHKTQH